MVKRENRFQIFLIVLLVMSVFTGCQKDNPVEDSEPQRVYSSLKECLDDAQNVASIQPIQLAENPCGYTEMYEVQFTQPVNHFGSSETFSQKAYVFYVGADRPTVLYTCGYDLGDRFKQKPYVDIAYNMQANLVVVEHRYFGDSKPQNDPRWVYLTMEQAAADHHAVFTVLKKAMPRQWLSTGTSKDGMASIFYRYFYPADIDVTTAFCSPLMTSLASLEVGQYLQHNCGTPEERSQMTALMKRFIKDGVNGIYRQANEKYKAKTGREVTFEEYVYDCFGYFFGQFSYTTPTQRKFPAIDCPAETLIDSTLMTDLTSEEETAALYPYMIQTAKQLGQFVYDCDAYREELQEAGYDFSKMTENVSQLKPEDVWLYDTYDNTNIRNIREVFLPYTTCPVLLVYSKDDPWTGARPTDVHSPNVKVIINPDGIHNHDINATEHYSTQLRDEIMDFIYQYIPTTGTRTVTDDLPGRRYTPSRFQGRHSCYLISE